MLRVRVEHEHPPPSRARIRLAYRTAIDRLDRRNRPALEIEYVAVDASNRIPLLQNGTVDVECGSTTNTAERQKQVSFSIATYVASPRWLVSAASPVAELNGLEGQTIVVTQGSLN